MERNSPSQRKSSSSRIQRTTSAELSSFYGRVPEREPREITESVKRLLAEFGASTVFGIAILLIDQPIRYPVAIGAAGWPRGQRCAEHREPARAVF